MRESTGCSFCSFSEKNLIIGWRSCRMFIWQLVTLVMMLEVEGNATGSLDIVQRLGWEMRHVYEHMENR